MASNSTFPLGLGQIVSRSGQWMMAVTDWTPHFRALPVMNELKAIGSCWKPLASISRFVKSWAVLGR